MKIFISGGCKNGKSTYAQWLVKYCAPPVPRFYIATMQSTDKEDDERILRHQQERDGWGFITIEQYTSIENILQLCYHNGSFLLDSLTALLANEMFSPTGEVDNTACDRICQGLNKIFDKLANIVVVSDYIYSDAFLYDEFTESYRRALATLDRLAAQRCDIVLEATVTQIVTHKGGDLLALH